MLFTKRPGENRLYQLECLRGLAALYVVLFHAFVPVLTAISFKLTAPFRMGQEFVFVFFVISGFAVHYSVRVRAAFDLGHYIRSRIWRIYPIFLFALALSYACYCLAKGHLVYPDWPVLLGNIVMQQDEWTRIPSYMGDVPLWSLSYECLYYAAYALAMVFLAERCRRPAFLIVGLLGCAATCIEPSHFAKVAMYAVVWWAGVELCEVHLGASTRGLLWPVGVMLAMVAALVVRARFGLIPSPAGDGIGGAFPIREIRNLLAGIATVAVIVIWAKLNWRGFFLQPFAYLAPISYGLYVVHYPIMVTLAPLGARWSPWAWFVVSGLAVVLIATLLEHVLQPWVTRVTKRPRPKTGTHAIFK
jgi:peptidoglycan/LPS O-acetylase OafA/YrhL